ncbi:MAG: hypothetical protein FH753_11075 [Firmicutes bacterium]|nr:hypothetical protein [Bacillota bacterium]
MSNIKRVNLSFDIDRPKDYKVYNILKDKRNKTAYIIETILASLESNNNNIDRHELKQVFMEVLKEADISIRKDDKKQINNTEDIPNEVFDIISSI